MSESDRRNKEADLGRINRDLQRLQREFREDLNLRRNEEFQQIIERANKVVQQIAEAEKFDLDPAGGGLPQPADRHHRESPEGARRQVITVHAGPDWGPPRTESRRLRASPP